LKLLKALRSTLAVMGIFFLLGLGLTFTPCVLPMVPILTSVVLGGGNTTPARGFWLSFLYVIGMAITYAAAGLAVGLLGAGANVQALMQSPPVLIGFAVLFLVLSLAMFGVYELQLPSGLRNRLNNLSQKQNGGSAVSVFIIGVLSALVVSPCVSAPLAGALAYLSTTGDAFSGALALLALGFGMGTPLIILGTTGATVLPRAGAWMNRIKYLFGFMLVGVAIWLVSRLLPGPLVLALWGALAVAVGIVAGALSSPTESAQRWLKTPALMIFIYGVVAIAGALQGNSDLLNPIGESTHSENEAPFVKTTSIAEINTLIAESQQPVMVDLYADWCISCKVMDKEIFAQEDAQLALRHLLWVQLDLTDNTEEHKAFMNTHGVFGPPTVLFFEAGSDNSQGRIIGERHKSEFVQEALGIVPAP
jgi:thiol:disulfide interchange protein DsbD